MRGTDMAPLIAHLLVDDQPQKKITGAMVSILLLILLGFDGQWMFVEMLLIGIASQTFALFQCYDHPNSKSYLRSRRDILCYEDIWKKVVAAGIIGIVVLCGAALTLFMYVIWISASHYQEMGFRKRWKFLFHRYRPTSYYWNIVMLLKGLWIILPTVFFTQVVSQIAFLCAGTVAYLLATSLVRPWQCSMASHCDVFMHGCLCFLLIFLPYFAVMLEKRGIHCSMQSSPMRQRRSSCLAPPGRDT